MTWKVRNLVDRIWKRTDSFIDLDRALPRLILETFEGTSHLEANELAHSHMDDVIRYLKRRMLDADEKGVTPRYQISATNAHRLVRSDLLAESEDGASILIPNRDRMLEELTKMGWRDFEFLCSFLLELWGLKNHGVTRPGKEHGIDFFGTLSSSDWHASRPYPPIDLRIIGQAKRWRNSVGPEKAAAFGSRVEAARKGDFTTLEHLPESFRENSAPVVGILATTSWFTGDAQHVAEVHGFSLQNGLQIAEALLHSQSASEWFTLDAGESMVFNDEAFKSFLQSLQEG